MLPVPENGYLKLWRKIRRSPVYRGYPGEKAQPIRTRRNVILSLLLLVAYEPIVVIRRRCHVRLQPGQVLISMADLAHEALCAESAARRALQTLASSDGQNEAFCLAEPTRAGNLITLINWGRYQTGASRNNQPEESEVTDQLTGQLTGQVTDQVTDQVTNVSLDTLSSQEAKEARITPTARAHEEPPNKKRNRKPKATIHPEAETIACEYFAVCFEPAPWTTDDTRTSGRAARNISHWLANGYSPDDLRLAIARCRQTLGAQENPRPRKTGNFFGRQEPAFQAFLDSGWRPPRGASTGRRDPESETSSVVPEAPKAQPGPCAVPSGANRDSDVWQTALAALRQSLDDENYETWIATILYRGHTQTTLYADVPSNFNRSWVLRNFRDRILEAFPAPLGALVLGIAHAAATPPERKTANSQQQTENGEPKP